MFRHAFYDSDEYQAKQSERTKRNQEKGTYEHLKRQVLRTCAREGCEVTFWVQSADPKSYCSRSCAASVSNSQRTLSSETREKIARANRGKENIYKGVLKVARMTAECSNPSCKRVFMYERYKTRTFCSSLCGIKTVGSRPTSPKASRGKAGVRPDIDTTTYFYSRWEANMARLLTHLNIRWIFEPRTFDIGGQTYTPDFYLPDEDMYVEVKNFWGTYSRIRDTKFRNTYPSLTLDVILKDEYRMLEEKYANLIPEWEYKNSLFQ